MSCGRPYSGVEVQIGTADGGVAPSGTPGPILVRGETVFAGYFGDASATAEVLQNGWLHTGDVGSLDDGGHLFVQGRARAMIKRGGSIIAPREIEDAVDGLPGVRVAAAIGVARESVSGTEDVVVALEIEQYAHSQASRLADQAIARDRARHRERALLGDSLGSRLDSKNGQWQDQVRRLATHAPLGRSRGAHRPHPITHARAPAATLEHLRLVGRCRKSRRVDGRSSCGERRR